MVANNNILEIISHLQLLMPDLIWDRTAYKNSHNIQLKFVTIKKRLPIYELEQTCNFIGGKNLTKNKLPFNAIRYKFIIQKIPLMVTIDTFINIKNVKTIPLQNNINIKFIE